MTPSTLVTDLTLKLRGGSPDDAPACGKIVYEAFKTISEQHGFPPDFRLWKYRKG